MAKPEIRRFSAYLGGICRAGGWAEARQTRTVRRMRWNVLLTALAVAASVLAGPGAACADQRDPRLNTLFGELEKAPDAKTAEGLANEIWGIWHHSGNAEIDRMLEVGVNAMYAQEYEAAFAMFNTVVEKAPEFAEGWNKRAHVEYLAGDYDSSIADVKKALSLEPRHWNALHGMGLIYEEMGEPVEALRWFEKALKLYPQMPQLREHIDQLRELTKGREI